MNIINYVCENTKRKLKLNEKLFCTNNRCFCAKTEKGMDGWKNNLINLVRKNIEKGNEENLLEFLQKGSGSELDKNNNGNFLAIHSSSALGVNSFGYFLNNPKNIVLGKNKIDLTNVKFEYQLKNFSGIPPNIDIILDGKINNEDTTILIESKYLEYFSTKKYIMNKKGNAYYLDKIKKIPKNDYELIEHLVNGFDETKLYNFDIAQMIKHLSGIFLKNAETHEFENKKIVLICLYWKTQNEKYKSIVNNFEIELKIFKEIFDNSENNLKIQFDYLSYNDLFKQWNIENDLSELAKQLLERYIF